MLTDGMALAPLEGSTGEKNSQKQSHCEDREQWSRALREGPRIAKTNPLDERPMVQKQTHLMTGRFT
jgi:hypothetical protein